jgi:hypothetical protein
LTEPLPSGAVAAAEPHPIRFVVTDDLKRSRLTTLFRLVLAIPHFLWIYLWQIVFVFALMWAWLVALIFGRLEDDLHSFLGRYVRYSTHVYAYVFLLANPYPRFHGFIGYPVDVQIDPAERQNRIVTLFRLVLAIPALIFTMVLNTVLQVTAIAAWFVALALGRIPRGLRDLGAYCLRFQTQTYAYICLLTSRYPSLASGSAPAAQPPAPGVEPPPDGELAPATPPHTP